MTEKMAQCPPSAPLTPEGLYFQIVCDPGHERTTRELSQLPTKSRERVWADMTGAMIVNSSRSLSSESSDSNIAQEHPAFLRERLDALDGELQLQPRSEDSALGIQTLLGRNEEFRLAFLRACDFDATQAAQRLFRHFEQKISLFGRSKVGDSIRLSDLSDHDLESLQCGALQFLPKLDRGGRLVLVSRYRNFVYKKAENMVRQQKRFAALVPFAQRSHILTLSIVPFLLNHQLRSLWYMLMSALDTPNARKAGLVVVGYEVGDFVPVDYELTRQMFRLVRNLPIRVVASHSCYSASPMQKVADIVVHMVSTFVRLRLRMHYGKADDS